MKTYEITYIVSDTVAEDKVSNEMAEVSKELERLGGVIVKEEPWGKRRLAYPIKRSQFGYYVTLQSHIENSKVKELDRFFRLHSTILRHLILASIPEPVKAADETELVESIEKRVEASKEAASEIVATETKTASSEEEKPKTTRVKKSVKSNESEKKAENDDERRKQVEEKLSEILKD